MAREKEKDPSDYERGLITEERKAGASKQKLLDLLVFQQEQ